MVVYRRAEENALARGLERRHLYHNRESLHYENAAHYYEREGLLGEKGQRPYHAPERKRSGVAHEHVGGVTVIPQKGQ